MKNKIGKLNSILLDCIFADEINSFILGLFFFFTLIFSSLWWNGYLKNRNSANSVAISTYLGCGGGGVGLPSSCLNLCLIGWWRQHVLPIITLVVITVCHGCVLLMVPSMHLSRRCQIRRNVSCLHIKRLWFTHTPVIFPICLVARLANVAVVSIGVVIFQFLLLFVFSVENQKVWKEWKN